MVSHQSYAGVWVPALTPFNSDLSVDRDAFVAHCHWLLDQGADGLAVFGTTSEANSLSVAERADLLEELVRAGVPAGKLMPGVGCCAIPDTVHLCRCARELGCGAVLMLPPFYYKGVEDEGLFGYFSTVIEHVAADGLQVFLYHIPPVTRIPISIALISRLRRAYPDQVAGLKDSGGDWSYTRDVISHFPEMTIFAGSERFLLETLRHGGAGCITASGNVNPAGIRLVFEHWTRGDGDVDSLQAGITAIRDVLEGFAMIPALKALCVEHYRNPAWATVRPPLTALTETASRSLHSQLEPLAFSVSDNRQSVLKALQSKP